MVSAGRFWGIVGLGLVLGLGVVFASLFPGPAAWGESTGGGLVGDEVPFIASAGPTPAHESQRPSIDRYFPPQDLEVRCQRMPDPAGDSFYRLEVRVTLLIGGRSPIRPFLAVSHDLGLVASLPSSIEIVHGRTIRLPFLVRRGSSTGMARDTWIRVGVEYHPDYEAILTSIRRIPRNFPDARMRHRLLDEIRLAARARKPVKAVFTIFPREDDLLESQGIRFSASADSDRPGGEVSR